MTKSAKKVRLDALVVERGLAESRARAQAIIMGGGVLAEGAVISKPASLVAGDVKVELVAEPIPYVSRGGLKLRHALDSFGISADGMRAVDIGASTGGFTDVLLQAGAECVYAIDVGYGQLAWSLRNNPRVVVMERTNVRTMESLPQKVDLAVIDVSFISLRLVLPPVGTLLTDDGTVVALIKPQFEAGRDRVGKKGVVRDPEVWRDVLMNVLTFAEDIAWQVSGLVRSPIRGPAGNVEFLAHLVRKRDSPPLDLVAEIDAVVME